MGKIIKTFYRQCADYQTRIDVTLTSQGYQVKATFINSPTIQPLVKYVNPNKDKAISFALNKLAIINNRINIEKGVIQLIDEKNYK